MQNPMQNAKKLAIVGFAVISLALPQLALAHSSSHAQSSASIQAGFVHWWSMGSAGPKPIQSIDGEKILGAPNGMLAEMAKSAHGQS